MSEKRRSYHNTPQPAAEIAIGVKASAAEIAALPLKAREAFMYGIAKIVSPSPEIAADDE